MGLGNVLFHRHGLILYFVLLTVISLPTLCLAKEPNVMILDQNITTVRLGYLLARTKHGFLVAERK